ncbi:hypothetical protein HNP46_000268 [Pseudomonas nitritireducens]|uniref:Uncharacterized protein n=1 Tax=Pseudomonas nitroreducens TaxID=46680 RepID=A0A7W7NZQ5_PSENT|nr:hypothetical protein [Pseudomonas nitritireducens]MBB4861457.1 hypothetical protein [Pseudomonas nitritireducens]
MKKAEVDYPIYLLNRLPGGPQSLVCVAGPEHAVEIVETTDPHNIDPLGFHFRIHRTKATVKSRMSGGQRVTKDEWRKHAIMLMMLHLQGVDDLITLCDMARRDFRIHELDRPDYSSVIPMLTSSNLRGHTRMMIKHRLEGGAAKGLLS